MIRGSIYRGPICLEKGYRGSVFLGEISPGQIHRGPIYLGPIYLGQIYRVSTLDPSTPTRLAQMVKRPT